MISSKSPGCERPTPSRGPLSVSVYFLVLEGSVTFPGKPKLMAQGSHLEMYPEAMKSSK